MFQGPKVPAWLIMNEPAPSPPSGIPRPFCAIGLPNW